MNSSSVPASACQPRSATRSSWRRRMWRGGGRTAEAGPPPCPPAPLGRPVELAAEDVAGRGEYRAAVLPLEVAHDQRGALVPGDAAQGGEVGVEDEVRVCPGPHSPR